MDTIPDVVMQRAYARVEREAIDGSREQAATSSSDCALSITLSTSASAWPSGEVANWTEAWSPEPALSECEALSAGCFRELAKCPTDDDKLPRSGVGPSCST
jgi:hypothetical protein